MSEELLVLLRVNLAVAAAVGIAMAARRSCGSSASGRLSHNRRYLPSGEKASRTLTPFDPTRAAPLLPLVR